MTECRALVVITVETDDDQALTRFFKFLFTSIYIFYLKDSYCDVVVITGGIYKEKIGKLQLSQLMKLKATDKYMITLSVVHSLVNLNKFGSQSYLR